MARIPKPGINKPQLETYNASHGTYAIYNALPSKVTMAYSLLIGGSVSAAAYYVGDTYADGKGQTFFYIAMGTMTALGLLLAWLRVRRLKKEAATAGSFEEAIKSSAAGWDTGGGSDPAEIARLDNLRKQFQKGIDTFKEYGKDFYSLPWYVMVGEPGSGKTEAIRHSDLRFPETLQDMLQGTGGTYSMDWWFTNQAVILDTAGAMLMNPEATQRFEEFLKLLRSFRPDCPVNGVILAIPVDSLLADNPSVLEEKAKRIARQFGVIQKALDVRFPIYLMVTKSDRLPGWREFTDAPGQQTFDREMLGWSNPADLDTPFDPSAISGALESIAWRLEGRRLALISDPIPRQPGVRRIDEVDSLFAFPETIRSLQPRLQRYMEIIFQTGTWATLPPFFRGVYFTSAMNEGAALDEQLAAALGMPIETLPGGGLFNRDKSVYLRDMFTEKVFKERGLVTRLKDIGKALRRKLVWFYATTAALLAILLLLAWMTKRNVETALKDEQENWRAANALWANGSFFPIVMRKAGEGAGDDQQPPKWTQAWQGDNARIWKQINESGNGTSAPEFLEYLEQRTRNGLGGAGMFRILGPVKEFEKRRRVACMAVFEGCVLKPVLEGVREKLIWDCREHAPRDAGNEARLALAYAALVKIEAAARQKDLMWEKKDYAAVLEPMLVYLCPEESGSSATNAASHFAGIASLLYGGRIFGKSGEDGIGTRAWLATEEAGQLGVTALKSGLDALLGSSGIGASSTESEEKKRSLEQQKQETMRLFIAQEDALLGMAPGEVTREKLDTGLKKLSEQLDELDKVRGSLGEVSAKAALSPDQVGRLCLEMTQALQPVIDKGLPSWLSEVHRRAQKIAADYKPAAAAAVSSATDTKPGEAPAMPAEQAARLRLEQYRLRLKQAENLQPPQTGLEVIGNLKRSITQVEEDAKAARAAFKLEYNGPRKAECEKLIDLMGNCFSEVSVESYFRNYSSRMGRELDAFLKFPLVDSQDSLTESEFFAARKILNKLEADRDFFQKEMRPAYQAAESGQKLDIVFKALEDVLLVAKIADPGNISQDAGPGIYLRVDPVPGPVDVDDPTDVPPPQLDPRFPPAPFTPRKIKVGIISREAIQNGSRKIQPDSTAEARKKIHPEHQLTLSVTYRRGVQPEPPATRLVPAAKGVKWGVLRYMQMNKDRRIRVGGVTFELMSDPAMPPAWPTRDQFPRP